MTLEQFIRQQPPERLAKLRAGDRAEADAIASEFNAATRPAEVEQPEQPAAPRYSFTKAELPQYLTSLERINPVLHSRIRRGDAAAAQEALDFDAKNFARFEKEGLSNIGEKDLDYFRWAKARGFTANDESIVTSFGRGLWNLAKGAGSFIDTFVRSASPGSPAAAELAATVVDGLQTNVSDSKMLGAGLAKMTIGGNPDLEDAAEFELARFANEERAKSGEWRRKVGGEAFAAIPVDPNASEFIGEVLAPDNLAGAGLGRAVVKQGLKRGLINEGMAKVALKDVGVPLFGQAKVLSEASLAARETLTGLEAKLAGARLTAQALPDAERAAHLADVVKPLEDQVTKARADFQLLYGNLERNRAEIVARLDSAGVGVTDRVASATLQGVGRGVERIGEGMSSVWQSVRGVADGEGDQLVDTLADQATGGATAVARQGNLVTKVGRDMKVLGETFAQGEASLPFFARVRQARKASRATRAAAALIDESRLGYFGGKAGDFTKAGAAGMPVSGAFGYVASGGDINAAAESAGFGFGMGVAGGAYGEWEAYRDPQVKVDELLGNRRNFRQWLIDSGDKQGQLQIFDSLDPENQLLVASYAHAHPDVGFVFERAGRNGPAGFYDRERNIITLNVESPDALAATFAHEISHYVERHGLANQVRDAFLGNAETGQLGEFTKIVDGKPVVREVPQPDGTTRREYELNDAGLELKRQYEERARKTISPDFVLSNEAFASELFAEQYADQLISGKFLRDLKGSPVDALANSALVKGVLGKLGVMFDQNDKVVGTGLFKGVAKNRAVAGLIREYNRQTARGKRAEMSDDADFEISEEALKNSELAVKWLQAGGAVKFDADGKPVYKGDRPQFLTAKEAEQVQRDLANELIKEIDAWVAANPDNPDAVQKRADGLYAGSFIPPEIIDKIEAQRKFNPYQLATLRAASQVLKQNGPGAILAHFYQAASKKGSSGYKTVAGRWRRDAIYGIRITKDANVLLQSFSWEQLFENARKAAKTKRARELWGTSGEALDAAIAGDVVQYLRNLEGGEPGATLLGEDKKDFINNLLGIRMASNEGVNPLFNVTASPKTIITSLRVDRMNRLTPLDTVEYAWGVDQYQRAKSNFKPGPARPGATEWVEEAAIKTSDGKVFRGRMHPLIIEENPEILTDYGASAIDGFVTNKGRFLDREQAIVLAVEAGQIPRRNASWLESSKFDDERQYSPGVEDAIRVIDAVGNKSATQVDPKSLPFPKNPVPGSVALPPRWGMVNRNIVGMPRSFAEVDEIVTRAVERLQHTAENYPDFARESARFYVDMAESALILSDVVSPGVKGAEKLLLADLMLRYLALGSPRTDVSGNATKSSGSAASYPSDFAPGYKIGFGSQQLGARDTFNAWAKGGHFDLEMPGIDDKVRSFYINGLSELLEIVQKDGDTATADALLLRAAKSLHLVDASANALSKEQAAEVQRLLDGKATVDMWDMAGKGFAWPGFILRKSARTSAKQPFQWSQDKFAKRATLGDASWKTVLKDLEIGSPSDLNYQQARALRIDGNSDWSAKTWAERVKQPFGPETEFTYFTEGTEAGLSPGGAGPMYDAQQGIDGLIADRLNELGLAPQFGKEKLKARNAQEILWAQEKLDNPIPRHNNLALYGNTFKSLRDEVAKLRLGQGLTKKSRAEAVLAAMDRAYEQMATQILPIEVVTKGTSEQARAIQTKIEELKRAGDVNAEASITRHVADGLGDAINDLAIKNDVDVTVDEVATGDGGYSENGVASVSPNIRLRLRGDRAEVANLLEAMSLAMDQDGGNVMRKPTVRELNDATVKKNFVVTFDTRGLPRPQRDAFFNELAALKDTEGRSFLTGFTEVAGGIAIGDQFYAGRMDEALVANESAIAGILAKYSVPGFKGDQMVIETFYRGSKPSPSAGSPFSSGVARHLAERIASATTSAPAPLSQRTDAAANLRARSDAGLATLPGLSKSKAVVLLAMLKSNVDAALLRGDIDAATAADLKKRIDPTGTDETTDDS